MIPIDHTPVTLPTAWALPALVAALLVPGLSAAQVAGESRRVDTLVTESTLTATGWSVKRTLMGQSIYNEAGQKVGEVEDLIISPERNLSFVIIEAGGFLGMGRHDVAIPMASIQQRANRLVMVGATRDAINAMPVFSYATDDSRRDAFVAAADRDIASGRVRASSLQAQLSVAPPEQQDAVSKRLLTLQGDLRAAESRLDELKRADAGQWQALEAGVSAALSRLRATTAATAG
ncbi:PRC-barrel domain-containing protein [Ideonella sp. 4Y16]|nr:PRC-barrel domain-containing protein [Ideonella alba]